MCELCRNCEAEVGRWAANVYKKIARRPGRGALRLALALSDPKRLKQLGFLLATCRGDFSDPLVELLLRLADAVAPPEGPAEEATPEPGTPASMRRISNIFGEFAQAAPLEGTKPAQGAKTAPTGDPVRGHRVFIAHILAAVAPMVVLVYLRRRMAAKAARSDECSLRSADFLPPGPTGWRVGRSRRVSIYIPGLGAATGRPTGPQCDRARPGGETCGPQAYGAIEALVVRLAALAPRGGPLPQTPRSVPEIAEALSGALRRQLEAHAAYAARLRAGGLCAVSRRAPYASGAHAAPPGRTRSHFAPVGQSGAPCALSDAEADAAVAGCLVFFQRSAVFSLLPGEISRGGNGYAMGLGAAYRAARRLHRGQKNPTAAPAEALAAVMGELSGPTGPQGAQDAPPGRVGRIGVDDRLQLLKTPAQRRVHLGPTTLEAIASCALALAQCGHPIAPQWGALPPVALCPAQHLLMHSLRPLAAYAPAGQCQPKPP